MGPACQVRGGLSDANQLHFTLGQTVCRVFRRLAKINIDRDLTINCLEANATNFFGAAISVSPGFQLSL